MEIYTLSLAWIYFETLIQKKIVRKDNRRVLLATCILVAFKMVQVYGGTDNLYQEYLLRQLRVDLDRLLLDSQPKRSSYTYEQVVLYALNFNLRPPPRLIAKHVNSILVMYDKELKDCIGEESYTCYQKTIRDQAKARKRRRRGKAAISGSARVDKVLGLSLGD